MKLLHMLLPPLAKARLRGDIDDLHRIALAFALDDADGAARLSGKRAALWNAVCNDAANLASQMFVHSDDKSLDWDLGRHRRRLNAQSLAAIYWWLLLYQLVLFRNRGIDGYDKAADFDALCHTAEALMAHLTALPHIAAVHPGPWEERWRAQVALEAAIGIYNCTMDILGISINTEARILRVSLFTTATERSFDANTRPAVIRAARSAGD